MAKIKIDPEQVFKLAARFWKNTEIAAFFGCDEGTIRKKFSDELIKGREVGKGTLRDYQLRAAKSGSAALLIWLGKQYLDQTEKIEVTNTELMKEEIEIISNGHKSIDYRNRLTKFINN